VLRKAILAFLITSAVPTGRAEAGAAFSAATGAFFAAALADIRSGDFVLDEKIGYETNPLLGRSPSDVKLYVLGTATATCWWLLSRHIYRRRPGMAVFMLLAGAAVELRLAEHNFHLVLNNGR